MKTISRKVRREDAPKRKVKKGPSLRRPSPRPAARLDWPADGLLPAVVRDTDNGRVLMQAYVNRESLKRTLRSGLVHFWSRKRKSIWFKGETSGNVLRLVDAKADCDGDSLLFEVRPAGPACHTGAVSCFFQPLASGTFRAAPEVERFGWEELYVLVASRKKEKPKGSYTTKLFEAGLDRIAQKVGEEAVETILAARQGEPGLFVGEVADLIYHLTVLMAAVGVTPGQVRELLRERHEVIEKKKRRRAAPVRRKTARAKGARTRR